MKNYLKFNVKLSKTQMLLVLPWVLGACSDLIGSVEPPTLASPPEALTEPCARPVPLPNREIEQSEVENLWIRDRANLIECGEYKKLLQEFFYDRDSRISGEKNV